MNRNGLELPNLISHFNSSKKPTWSGLVNHNGVVAGCWWFGRWYNTSRDNNGHYFYGAYPKGFIERVQLLFAPLFPEGSILHLFSGTMVGNGEQVITFDIRLELNPNVVGNAEKVGEYFTRKFDLILADPPYEDNYKKYGTPKFSRKKVIQSCSQILKPNGYLCWLDTMVPQWRKQDGWLYRGDIGIIQSTNHRVRALTILQKV